ncbi:MAG: MATE family efflux transporter [Variibacter sp.]
MNSSIEATLEVSPTRSAWMAELRATLALGWPLILTNLAQIALTTTDVIFIGHLGPDALAAGTLGANLYFAFLIFAIGLMTATAPMMARALGRNRFSVRDVRRTFRQGLWAGIGITIPAWIVLWNAEAVLLLLGQKPELAASAETFLHGLQWGYLPFLGFIVIRSFISALERPRAAVLVTGLAVLFNAAANWCLVFGHLGFPALGLVGSGIASTLSNFFMFGGLALVLALDRRFRRYRLFGRFWRPDWPRLRELLRLGLPIAATMMFEVTTFNGAVVLMGLISAPALAAHAIAIQIASTTFMVPLALGQAATVRVGRALGAQDNAGITRAGWVALALGVGFMTATAALMIFAPRLMAGAFVDVRDAANAEVITLAVSFLFWAAVFQIADGAQVVGAGMLRGLHDTRVPMFYAAFGYWGLGLPVSAALAFAAGLGGTGIWIGLAVGLAVVAVLMVTRWSRREALGLVPTNGAVKL